VTVGAEVDAAVVVVAAEEAVVAVVGIADDCAVVVVAAAGACVVVAAGACVVVAAGACVVAPPWPEGNTAMSAQFQNSSPKPPLPLGPQHVFSQVTQEFRCSPCNNHSGVLQPSSAICWK